METIRLIRGSGFLMSSGVTAAIGVMLIELINTPSALLFWTVFILPFFFGGLFLRGRVWLSMYRESGGKNPLQLITALALIPLGAAMLVLFALYALGQTVVLNLSEYTGVGSLLLVAVIWTVYSLMELSCAQALFKSKFMVSALLLVPIVLVDASLAFLLRFSVYFLPAAMFVLAASTAAVGSRLMFGKEDT